MPRENGKNEDNNSSRIRSIFGLGRKDSSSPSSLDSITTTKGKAGKGSESAALDVFMVSEKEKKKQHQGQQQGQKKKTTGAKLDFQDKFASISMRYFGKFATKLEGSMPKLGEDLLMSNYFLSPNAFLSIILFISVLSISVAAFGVLMAITTHNLVYAAAAMTPLMVFGIGLSLPKSSRSSRASAIDGELAFVIGYLSVLISGGVSPINLFKRLSTSNLYPACAKEARRIVINVDVLGMDPVSAIEKAARYTPNKVLSDFLAGYIAVLKIGGDIRSFMDQKQKEVFNQRSLKLKSSTDFVGTLAEAYLAATVVMGISLFILQIVSSMVQKGAIDYTMMYFYAGVFMPLISGVFIFLLHSIQVKEPIVRKKEHIAFFVGLLAVPLMIFAVPADQPLYLKLGIGLALSTIAPAVISEMESRKKRAAESMLPSFVLDLAEVRKTGLAPEKCIEQLATRNYGALTKYVRRMATQVSWGVPLNKVLKDFGKDLNSWFVVSIGFILLEVVEVGGGTPGLFGSLADFTQRTRELEKERKSMFRPYIFMPYIGAILTVISTVLIITMMTNQLASLASKVTGTYVVTINPDTKTLTNVMLTAAIFQGWLMGIVGGKMAEWSIGAGYKHATMLVTICLLTSYLVATFVKI